ncbi:hypothetical protein NIES4071_70880 [Calothrix sp. NIES-4071]|nr:hypothetical protein NIES4071_70880 [Calothrix sp. NIES-4071]BAZ61363.1 hypothetical protein NIES4105_70830 [Calothrix sp. NIES-4105]
MIKDDFEYQVSQEWVKKFQHSIDLMDKDEERKSKDFLGWESNRSALLCHIEKLQAEIAEYESLVAHDSHTPIVLTLEDIYYFPQLLIRARIASKLSHKELAALSSLTEEKLKHYEDKDYDGATFSEMMGVFFALDMKVKAGEFLVPLDSLRRTPMKIEDVLSKGKKKAESDKQIVG